MAEITIRFRSSQGQFNIKTSPSKQLAKLLGDVAPTYGLSPAKLAARLYRDPSYEDRLIRQSFSIDTPASQFFNQNGQIVYVKLLAEECAKEEETTQNADKPLSEMTMEELYQYTVKPRTMCPDCSHSATMYCVRCLKWWETSSLKAAGVNPLVWEKFKTQRVAEQKREAFGKNVSTVADVRGQTAVQVKITAESAKVYSVYAANEWAAKLSQFMSKRYFNHEFKVRLFGMNEHGHVTVEHSQIPYYETLFGSQIIKDAPYFQNLNELNDQILQKFFNLQCVGNGYVTFSGQLTAKHLISACKDEKSLALLIRQYDQRTEDVSRPENVKDDVKFKVLNQTATKEMQLTMGAKQRDAYAIEAYTVTDQLRFLYAEGQIAPQQGGNPFELSFLSKQIIDDQFKDTVDTAAFITRVFQMSRGPGGETVRITQQFSADVLFEVLESAGIDAQQSVKQNAERLNRAEANWGRDILYAAVIKCGIEILFDPDFLLLCCVCGLNVMESKTLQDFAKRLKQFLL